MSLDTTNPPHVTGYLLLFRSPDWEGYSVDQVIHAKERVQVWFEQLGVTGKLAGAQPLMDDAVVISGKGGRTVTDGPFAETKEAIGGYVLLTVDTMEEAVVIAQANPMNDYGLTTEVRPTASSCAKFYKMLNGQAEAVAS